MFLRIQYFSDELCEFWNCREEIVDLYCYPFKIFSKSKHDNKYPPTPIFNLLIATLNSF